MRPLSRRGHTRGIALVLVLAFLVLITGLIIAFFTSVTNDLVTAKTATGEVSARQLADSTTQIVQSQIRAATSYGGTYAWACQPGMIRVYDSDGKVQGFYKLYSSDKMSLLQTDATTFQMTDDQDKDFLTKPAYYADLNSPVMITDPANPSGAAKSVFPIIDPRARPVAPSTPANPLTTPPNDGVDGFNYSPNDLTSGAPVYSSVVVSQGSDARLPMPVRWLYVLRDGSLTVPTTGGDGYKATFTKAPVALQPTSTNPIVGRMAFWTDDETSKVNINTASEGTYWDIPRVWTADDTGKQNGTTVISQGLAVCQPAQKEFQRYPGHPATTCLSPVLGWFFNPGNTQGPSTLDPYYDIVPRIIGGGSLGGTAVPQQPLVPDQDRLYASIDELLFKPTLATSGTNRALNPAVGKAPVQLTQDVLEKARFFLTANSRAPEVNLFNLPRISMWPEWDAKNTIGAKGTARDNLLAFCSSIGVDSNTKKPLPYYFTRQDPRSPATDYNNSTLGRNPILYSYLQRLTSQKIPGFPGASSNGTFATKYPAATGTGPKERDQILTSIYDYIRCTNLNDTTNGATPYTQGGSIAKAGFGEVIPIVIGSTQGFGRTNTVSQAALDIYATKVTGTGTAAVTTVRAVFLMELSGVMQGLCPDFPKLQLVVTGLDKFQIGLTPATGAATMVPLGLPAGGSDLIEASATNGFHGRGVGGTEGLIMTLNNSQSANGQPQDKAFTTPGATALAKNYPFFSTTDVTLANGSVTGTNANKMDFSGGDITVEIHTYPPENALIQTLHFKFPPAKATQALTMPTLGTSPVVADFTKRIGDGGPINGDGVFRNLLPYADTIISMEVAGSAGNDPAAGTDATAGDIRMIAALPNVPDTYFRAHNNYLSGAKQAHSLMAPIGAYYMGGNGGLLVQGFGSLDTNAAAGAYGSWSGFSIRNADLPSRVGVTGIKRATLSGSGPGDWDSGVGLFKDGAYINKSDDGDVNLGGTRVPYVESEWVNASAGETFFSPNRQVSSPMMIGSIPTGVQRRLPWQTLLFRPNVGHPGAVAPADHLLADLFWMPVVEPYAISEPFSTAGKVNMNYQLMPFGNYIRRDTAVRAVMKATKFAAIRSADGVATYKPQNYGQGPAQLSGTRRFAIDAQTTLDKGFETRFAGTGSTPADIFRSASEISTIDLYTPGWPSLTTFWTLYNLTGDNLREKPYGDMYSRLTTKSNTFTVHVISQSLRQSVPDSAAATDPRWTQWDERKDQILGQYRGSSIIERYIDASDTTLPDFASAGATVDVSPYYKFRTVSTKQFGQ